MYIVLYRGESHKDTVILGACYLRFPSIVIGLHSPVWNRFLCDSCRGGCLNFCLLIFFLMQFNFYIFSNVCY
jgi:hypothetical protein